MAKVEQFHYDNAIVRKFAWASIIFGLIGMLVGLLLALQFVFPSLNFSIPYTTFGRIRPLHTNAVIFAFIGNAIFVHILHRQKSLMEYVLSVKNH